MTKRQQVKTFGLSQKIGDIGAEYWNWSDDEKDKHYTDSHSILKHICHRLWDGLEKAGETGIDLEFEFCGINHDKDTLKINEVFQPVDEHIHVVVTLSKKRDLNVIAEWIGLEKVRFEIPKGRYGKSNMLAYLIHAKDPETYQYDPSEVETFGTFDYLGFCGENKVAWEKRSATVRTKNNRESSDWLKQQVQQGFLSMRQIMEDEEYKYVYADNMQLIDDAFRFYGMERGFDTLRALENGEFELTVIFITGKPGSGKTHFALDMIKDLAEEKDWRSYQAPGTNPMDGYGGEEIILLDDLRAQSLDATAWLQMLDARTSANIDARYKHKQKAYRTLVITSYLEPYEFFSYVKGTGGRNEALDQFIRRIMLNVYIHRLDDGGRYVEIEAIGITPEVVYDIQEKRFVPPNDSVETYANGLPRLNAENGYNKHQLDSISGQYNFKILQHAGYPIYDGDVETANDFLKAIITSKNNPEVDHSKAERPKVGSELAFWNEHPKTADALKIEKCTKVKDAK